MICCSFKMATGQTLFTYGSYKVSTEEFLKAYNKNNSGSFANAMTAKDYLTLFSNFKLKVQAARDLKMDTLPNLIQDATVFQDQIMDSYMTNEAGVKAMQKEAFARSQEDRRVIHYNIPATGKDSVTAESQARSIFNALQKGTAVVAGAAYPGLVVNDIGFITVFSVPYVYEQLIYNTAVGGYTTPILRNKKWHIFHVKEKRPAIGQWKAAQILLAFPEGNGASAADKNIVKLKADSIYNLLQNGMLFEKAAEEFSNDRITNVSGGLMPTFGTGRYSSNFEEPIFALKTDGAITKPFATEYGYHIVKRIAVTPVPADETDFNYQYELRQKISTDSRMTAAREEYANEIVKKTGWAVTNNALKKKAIMDGAKISTADQKGIVGKFKSGKPATGSDWKQFVENYWKTHEQDGTMTNELLWDMFVKELAAYNYKTNINLYNPAFSSQMKEFIEGNLLFEVMEKKVWSQAGNDEAALKKYYAEQPGKYIWNTSADAIVINCSSKAMAEQTIAAMKAGKPIATLIDESKGSIFTDSSRFELDQLIDKNLPLPIAGTFSPAMTNSENGGSFVYFKKIYPAGEQKSYDAARGQVINDYQEVLEKNWLAQLRKTYPVKYNDIEVKKLK